MGLIVAVALVNDLGKYHGFQPYDHEVYGVALLIAILWYVCFGNQAKAWAEQEQAKLDREEDGNT
jgi:hypothetical protein